jgi:GWxTD domain-containing protein
MNKLLYQLIVFALLLLSCKGPRKVTVNRNYAGMYNPGTSRLHPVYTVYHASDSISDLLMKIFPVELLYAQTNREGKNLGKVNVNYVLLEIRDGENNVIADSGQYLFTFEREAVQKSFVTKIPLKAVKGKNYELQIKATDLVRKDENKMFIMVDKRSEYSQQNFMLLSNEQGLPYFAPYVVGNKVFKIQYRQNKYREIYVSYYGKESPLPKPTFSLARERLFLGTPDSMWTLPFRAGLNYMLEYEGLYHFQLDTTIDEGLTILNFGENYPKIEQPEQLVEPLAYLMISSEYDNMKSAINKKLEVDNFWLDKAGDIERARELIRIYYNRVYFANYYFTSFKQGWKTDRGMIYIIYGPPQALYRSDSQEKWIYYRKSFSSSITFIFNYTQSPYAINHYILQRSESYDWHWREAVESWKKGRVYILD